MNEQRLGFVGIIVQTKQADVELVNRILSEFADIIKGRMGLPYKDRDCSVITIIVDANTDQIGMLTGKLGQIEGVSVKSALSKIE